MRFHVLGTFEVRDHGRRIGPSAPKQRSVLALLLASANTVVPTETLMEELWEGRPPASAQTTLQTYIYQLRKLLAGVGPGTGDVPRLLTRYGGYLLAVAEDDIDAVEFERLVGVAAERLRAGTAEAAFALLRQALALWRGPVLADVAAGPRLTAYAARLEELRVHAVKLGIEAQLRLGRHHAVIGELKELTAVHPLDEWLHLRLMEALSRVGRRHEALEVYRRLRRALQEELGLEPGAELRRLQQAVLMAEHPMSAAG